MPWSSGESILLDAMLAEAEITTPLIDDVFASTNDVTASRSPAKQTAPAEPVKPKHRSTPKLTALQYCENSANKMKNLIFGGRGNERRNKSDAYDSCGKQTQRNDVQTTQFYRNKYENSTNLTTVGVAMRDADTYVNHHAYEIYSEVDSLDQSRAGITSSSSRAGITSSSSMPLTSALALAACDPNTYVTSSKKPQDIMCAVKDNIHEGTALMGTSKPPISPKGCSDVTNTNANSCGESVSSCDVTDTKVRASNRYLDHTDIIDTKARPCGKSLDHSNARADGKSSNTRDVAGTKAKAGGEAFDPRDVTDTKARAGCKSLDSEFYFMDEI